MRFPRLTAVWLSLLLLLTGGVAPGRVRGAVVPKRPAAPAAVRRAESDAPPLLRAERVAVPAAHVAARSPGGLGQPSAPSVATLSARWSIVDRPAELWTSHAVAALGGVLPYFPTAPPALG